LGSGRTKCKQHWKFVVLAVGLILLYSAFFLDWLKHCPQENCASYIEDRDDIPEEPPY